MKLKFIYLLSLLLLLSCGEMTDFENDNVIVGQTAVSRSADEDSSVTQAEELAEAATPTFTHSFYISNDLVNMSDPGRNSTHITADFTSSVKGYTAILKLYFEKYGEEADEDMVIVTRKSNLDITVEFKRGGIYFPLLEVYDPSGNLYSNSIEGPQILVQ